MYAYLSFLRFGRAAALCLVLPLTMPAAAQSLPQDALAKLSARRIVSIADGDFLAQTYADGRLAPGSAGHRDLLTVMTIAQGRITTSSIPVSNSVTAAPEILEMTRDGNTAFIAERLGQRPPGATTTKELPPGRLLQAVDLSKPEQLRVADTALIAPFPESLAVSPDGRRVAVVSNTPVASVVQIVSYHDGRFGPVAHFDLAALGVRGTTGGPRGGVSATNVRWHPSGNAIAVNINTQNRIAFFTVDTRSQAPTLRPWGNIVEVGRDPFVGRFTPDGRHYLTSDWGRDFGASSLEGRLPTTPSELSVIRLADPAAAGDARHMRIGSVATGHSAEGLAISPDGRLIATVNMRGTALPTTSPRFQRDATISLLSFDPATGKAAKLGDYPFEGMLPEGGTFDLTGDHLIATVFQGHPGSGPATGAGLEVFRVQRGATPSLVKLGRVAMPHGTHHVDLAR